MALDVREIELITAEVIDKVEKKLIERGDERYVKIESCTEKQDAVNKKFANDDKRIDIIIAKISIWEKLLWAIATASIGALVVSVFELILK